jgi:hypothetical protein
MLENFKAALRRKTNFHTRCDSIELMTHNASQFQQLRSFRCYPELSSSRLLTFEPLGGQGLEQILREQGRSDALARRLCHVWLHQSLRGHCFPVDPQPHNIVLVPGANQIAFLNCDLARLPQGARENLSSYFDAVMSDDPNRAAMFLLREMRPPASGRIDIDSFHSSFRQSAFFGMLEPVLGSNSNAIAQVVFQHWKTALEHGYSPKPHLLDFYRGLFAISRIAYKLSPAEDGLREGAMELRMTCAFDELRSVMDWRHWYQNSDKFASALLCLPGALDEALSAAAMPQEGIAHSEKEPTEGGRQGGLPVAFMCAAICALCLLIPTAAWSEKLTLLVLMIAGVRILQYWKK